MIKIHGHRGFSENYPENTILAFQKTMEAGAEAAEMDVRVTADGEYIILHDETVDRTTNGTGYAKSLNYRGYIDGLDAGSWFAPQFAGLKIPTLDEVLTEFKGKNIKLVLQFYFTGTSRSQNIRDCLDKVIAKGMIGQVYIFAPPEDINEVKAYNNSFYTLNSGMATISTYQSILDNAIANNHNAVSITSNANNADLTTMVTAIKNAGKQVHISYLTGSYESRVQRFIDYGADFILGNNPLIMQNYVNGVFPPDPEQPEPKPGYLLASGYAIKKPYGVLKSNVNIVKNGGLLKLKIHQTYGEDLTVYKNPMTNLITNGDFSNGAVGWATSGGTLTASNNTGTIAMTGTGNVKQLLGDPVTGDKYYAKLKVTPKFQLNRIDLALRGSTSVNTGLQSFAEILMPTPNISHALSGIATVQSTFTGKVETPFRFYIEGTATGNIEIQYFIVINLTKTFGAGKEPTKAEMDAKLSNYPNNWFDGIVEA